MVSPPTVNVLLGGLPKGRLVDGFECNCQVSLGHSHNYLTRCVNQHEVLAHSYVSEGDAHARNNTRCVAGKSVAAQPADTKSDTQAVSEKAESSRRN